MRIGRERGWAVVMRTFIIDQIITKAAQEGFDRVLNLGAGFDTRPYRLDLPPTLSWIDVDQEKVITTKRKQLDNVAPRVPLQFVTADLSDTGVRQGVLDKAAEGATKILVLSEGVMCYLPDSSARIFASQLHASPVVHTWVADFMSPAMLRYARSAWTSKLVKAPFIFAVEDAGAYFRDLGWHEERWYSVADAGCAADRAPWRVRLSHAVHKVLTERPAKDAPTPLGCGAFYASTRVSSLACCWAPCAPAIRRCPLRQPSMVFMVASLFSPSWGSLAR